MNYLEENRLYEKLFAERLAALRIQKNISAREMSLALGQNESYINRIENGKAFPSMQVFFYICEYLGITPREFWDIENESPKKTTEIINTLKKFDSEQLDALLIFISKIN